MDKPHRLSWIFRDALRGVARKKWILLLALVFFFSMCLRLNNDLSALPDAALFMSLSAADFFAYLFGGTPPFVPESGERFILPEIWLFQHIALLVILSGRISRGLEGEGVHLLMRCGRTQWVFGKYCSAAFSALVLYLLVALTGLLMAVFGVLQLSPHMDFLMWSGFHFQGDGAEKLFFFLLPLLGLITFSILQSALELLFSPAVSWVAIVVVLSLSAYFNTPFLIGNSTMLLRVFSYSADDAARLWMLLSNIFCLALCAGLGFWRIHKMDLTCHKNGLGA